MSIADTPQAREREEPRLSQDATVVLALARTALPFARSQAEEAERWVRVMRMHGQVGAAMQSLGVSEGPLEPPTEAPAPADGIRHRRCAAETVARVCADATELARLCGAACVGTVHVLFAVVQAYGSAFDHELYRHGTTRSELFARLSVSPAPGTPG